MEIQRGVGWSNKTKDEDLWPLPQIKIWEERKHWKIIKNEESEFFSLL